MRNRRLASRHLVVGDTNNSSDVFVHDCQTGETTRVSVSSTGEQGTGPGGFDFAFGGSMSADGRLVALESAADNLVVCDTNVSPSCAANGRYCDDIFVHDPTASILIPDRWPE